MLLYRYFHDFIDPFRNFTDFNFSSGKEYVRYIKEHKIPCPRSYDEYYFEKRIIIEKEIRQSFIDLGGKPINEHPIYMVLGNCDYWFYRVKRCVGSLAIPLNDFDTSTISFTYGDSLPSFDAYPGFIRPYSHKVYTIDSIYEIIKKYGLPQNWNADGSHGWETYIEVQVWNDAPLIFYRPTYALQDDIAMRKHCYMVAKSVVNASTLICCPTSYDYELFHILSYIKKSPYWSIFKLIIEKVDKSLFMDDKIHGFQHCLRCAIYIFAIGNMLNVSERTMYILVYAALFHDVGRTQNGIDTIHGEIAAQRLTEYIPDCLPEYIGVIQAAIHSHCLKDESISTDILRIYTQDSSLEEYQFVTNLLKDVDSLDYIRLGIPNYNTKYLHNNASYNLVISAIELNLLFFRYPDYYYKTLNGIICL